MHPLYHPRLPFRLFLEEANLRWVAELNPRLAEMLAQAKEDIMSPCPVHPFAPFPDDPADGWTEEQIRILSGQLIKR